ncbi:hypothetical protein FQZ97_913250 [compost metagenome]
MTLEHLQHAGGEGGDGCAFRDHGVRFDQALHRAFARHGHLQAGYVDQGRLGVGDEVDAVDRLEDIAEGGQADQEHRQAESHRLEPAEHAHAGAARAVLARLGEVFPLQGAQQVAGADQFAAEQGADQVAQGGLLAWLEVMELAADAAVVGIHRAHLELDIDAQVEAVQLELQAASMKVADLHRHLAGAEAETAGRDVADRLVDPLAVLRQVAQHGRDLDPRMLPLGFRFMDHIDVDGCIHGCKFLFEKGSGRVPVTPTPEAWR